jgi:hypothetical protein
MCQRFMEAEIRAKDESSRTVELSFSSEVPVERWYGNEILAHDADSVDIQRLLDVGVVLFSHGRDVNYGKMPIAKIDRAWVDTESKKGRAEITFDDDEDSEKVFQKVKKGFIKGVSFGYTVSNWEEVAAGKKSINGRFNGPAYVGLRWEPYEISIEPTPADPQVGVGRSTENTLEPPPAEPGNREKDSKNPPENALDFSILRKKLDLKTKF